MKISIELDSKNKEHMRFIDVMGKKEFFTFITHAQLGLILEQLDLTRIKDKDHFLVKAMTKRIQGEINQRTKE